ncbi:TPA: WG repeat-containing protein [Campylobacter lari]|nr:WG repeat-containing protein [Campylobacter lari]
MYYASFEEDSILFDINGNILKKIAGKIYHLNDDLYGLCCTKAKCGLIDKQGNLVLEAKHDDIYDFSEGLGRVELNGKWGFIDKQGNLVIEAKYDDIYDFSEGLAIVKLNGKYGFIDKKGNCIIETEYDVVLNLVKGVEYDYMGFADIDENCCYSEILKFDTNLFLLKKGEELKLKNLN